MSKTSACLAIEDKTPLEGMFAGFCDPGQCLQEAAETSSDLDHPILHELLPHIVLPDVPREGHVSLKVLSFNRITASNAPCTVGTSLASNNAYRNSSLATVTFLNRLNAECTISCIYE